MTINAISVVVVALSREMERGVGAPQGGRRVDTLRRENQEEHVAVRLTDGRLTDQGRAESWRQHAERWPTGRWAGDLEGGAHLCAV